MAAGELARSIDALWRIEAGAIIGALARIVRDVGLAEDLAQEALLEALDHWPREGLPDKPGAWLMATAKHKALDHLRQQALHARKREELGADADARGDHVVPDLADGLDARHEAEVLGDDLLRLIFTACHPVLPKEAQTALTLKLLGGLSTEEIARAYVVPVPTIAQRIVRAKKTLAAARVAFELPRGAALRERLQSVLEVIYLVFNEGYAATSGQHWIRQPLCDEGLRLARILAQRLPQEAEVQGLQALLELQASRLKARTDAQGEPILLLDQDRSRWDRLLIGRGLQALARAQGLHAAGGAGPYELQAAIAAVHARATEAGATDWAQIVQRYGELAAALPSPIVELNRAVAVGMAQGAAAALPLVDALQADAAMPGYALLHSVRGDLLAKLGRAAEARAAFERAAAITQNQRERKLMLDRARSMAS
jgi:RNA polymerase sigma factor (sigma-70 family)